jgi:hypothetical protein
VSFMPKSVVLSALTAILSGFAMAQPALRATDARETPNEKGQTPSEIAAEYARQGASAAARQAREAQAMETRRQAVSVPSDTDECLAYHRSERRCLVTVGEFNRRLASDTRWTETMADSGSNSGSESARILEIRSKLLATLIEERYHDELVENPGKAGRLAEEAWQAQLAGITASGDEEKLRASYRKHAASFAPQREVRAEFLAASDSAFLDSLVGCMLDTSRTRGPQAKDSAERRCASASLYRWAKPRPEELPEIWRRTSRQLRKGEISGIVRCRFGWFVAAATQVTEVPGKSYAEARPLLEYMQGLRDPSEAIPAPANKNAPTAAPGIRDGNPERLDDSGVRVWLLPSAVSGNGRKSLPPAWTDTVALGALRLRLSDLPADVACEASALLRKDNRAFLKSRFGTWYFRADKNLPASPDGKRKPCGEEPLSRPPAPDIVSLAAEALAGKERDFKRRFLESQSGSGDVSGGGAALPPLSRWIAENVTLEDNVLKRF